MRWSRKRTPSGPETESELEPGRQAGRQAGRANTGANACARARDRTGGQAGKARQGRAGHPEAEAEVWAADIVSIEGRAMEFW